MLVTLFGIVTEVKLPHLLKASFPMLVTLFGIDKEVKLLQPAKAPSPMLVTLLGIFTEVKLSQLLKASFPMLIKSVANLITPLPSTYVFETIVGSASTKFGATTFPSVLEYQISSLGTGTGTGLLPLIKGISPI